MSGISRDAYLSGVGGKHWGSEVIGFALDEASKALTKLSNSTSNLFSSIYKNHLEPLLTSCGQDNKSITDNRLVDASRAGIPVKQTTVKRGISGTPASRAEPQVSYKLSSPQEYKGKLIALHKEYKKQETGYNDTYDRHNCGHDHGRDEEHYAYLLDPYSKAMAQLLGQIKGYTEEFERDFPNESKAFQKELLTTKHQEETSRESYTDYSIYQYDKKTKTQAQDNKQAVSSDLDWWY
ncbi:MAG: hypothetical protein JSR93_11640 [Verrucomicrobia bacterium]|nr:hypothetical protein [Verrucomicrobiota bacterium]